MVVKSSFSSFQSGDHVVVHKGWQSYIICDDNDPRLMKLDLTNGTLSAHLGVVGMPGRTAYFGLNEVGKPKARNFSGGCLSEQWAQQLDK